MRFVAVVAVDALPQPSMRARVAAPSQSLLRNCNGLEWPEGEDVPEPLYPLT